LIFSNSFFIGAPVIEVSSFRRRKIGQATLSLPDDVCVQCSQPLEIKAAIRLERAIYRCEDHDSRCR
jgi:hypothetical protein